MKTLRDLLNELIGYRQSLNHSQKHTLPALRNQVVMFLIWLETTYSVITPDQLRKDHLQRYQKHISNRLTAKGTPLKPGSINCHVKALHSFLQFLYRQGCLSVNLSDTIQYVREPKMLPLSVLTHTQIRKVLRNTDTTTSVGYRNRTILEVFYSTGIRHSELLQLTMRDIDLDQGTLRVLGKGQKERMVPLGKTALRYLEGYIKAIRPFWKGSYHNSAVFLGQTGNPLESNGLKRLIQKCCKDAPVHVTPHTFRRSCTTELVRSNANLYHVKELLGHASLDTLQPYTKLTINDLKKTHSRCHPREKETY